MTPLTLPIMTPLILPLMTPPFYGPPFLEWWLADNGADSGETPAGGLSGGGCGGHHCGGDAAGPRAPGGQLLRGPQLCQAANSLGQEHKLITYIDQQSTLFLSLSWPTFFLSGKWSDFVNLSIFVQLINYLVFFSFLNVLKFKFVDAVCIIK